MKALAIILFLSPIWAVNSLAQEKEVTDLLSNSESRTTIFNEILNDHQLMMDFMDAIKDNPHAMMMIRSDSAMMGNSAMGGKHMNWDNQMMGNMMDMCDKDSTRCEHMAEVMSEHTHMMMDMQKTKEKESGNLNSDMKMMNGSGEIKDTKDHHMHK